MTGTSRRVRGSALALVVAVVAGAAAAQSRPARAAASLPDASGTGAYALTNAYWNLSGSGATTQVGADATGSSQYATVVADTVRLTGAAPDPAASWTRQGNSLVVQSNAAGADTSFSTAPANADPAYFATLSDPVQPGHSLGQSFTVSGSVLNMLAIPVYTYAASSVTLGSVTLRQGGPTGAVLASLSNLVLGNGDFVTLPVNNLPSGSYYVELANSSSALGWPKVPPTYTGGQAYSDGAVAPGVLRYLRVTEHAAGIPATVRYTLDGADLHLDYVVGSAGQSPAATDPGVELVSPWQMSGYGLAAADGVAISRFFSDSGQYLGAAQFKRDNDRIMQDYYAMSSTNWERIDGTAGGDLQLLRPGAYMRWSMDASTLITRVTSTAPPTQGPQPGTTSGSLVIHLVPHENDGQLPSTFPEFVASDAHLAQSVTQFYRERGFSFTGATFEELRDWVGRERDWTSNPLAQAERTQLLNDRIEPSGYVWSWPTQESWPWAPSPASLLLTGGIPPPANVDVSGYDSRHFTTNSNFILGSAQWWRWTHDAPFLSAQMPRVRAALAYLLGAGPLGLDGQTGLIVTNESHDNIRNHTGAPGPPSAGSNWWDGLPYGNLDAYANLYFFQALEGAATLEDAAGNPAQATSLRQLENLVRTRYTATFWNAAAGRFVQTIGEDNTVYDFGSVYVNLEAIAAGLATDSEAAAIWHWLDTPTSSGQPDAFSKWVFAPRSVTVHNTSWWDWVFLYYFGLQGDFNAQVEDGGAAIYLAYFDVMARMKTRGVDDAYARFAQVIDRYSKPDHLAGGSPLYFGEIQQHLNPGQVATDTPFPEAGLAAQSFLNGFLGIDARGDALTIDPHLPQKAAVVDQSIYAPPVSGPALSGTVTYPALPWAGVRHVDYRGSLLDVMERYDSGKLGEVDIDVANAPTGGGAPVVVAVHGFDAASQVTGAAATWDSAAAVWRVVIDRAAHIVIGRIPAQVVPEAPWAPATVLLGAVAVAAARRRSHRQAPR